MRLITQKSEVVPDYAMFMVWLDQSVGCSTDVDVYLTLVTGDLLILGNHQYFGTILNCQYLAKVI